MANSSDIIKIGFDYRASLAQFEKETNGVFDGISEKAGKQKIVIQLDAKNDKVIEKIKELQKLKLDKFTFEFGDSGIKEQLKTFGQLENKINEIINLSKGLDNIVSKTDFGTKNKTEAYNQLKQMADVFKNFYGNEEAMHTKAGTKAAHAYYKAYEEALRKGVAESKLQKVTVDVDPSDSFFTADKLVYDRMQQYDNKLHYGGTSDLTEEIASLESRLNKFSEAYAKVKINLGEAPITPDIVKNIEEYVRYLEIADARERDTSLGFTKNDIEDMRDIANMNLGFAMDDAIKENEKYISSLKEVKEEKEKVDETISKFSPTSSIDDSKFEELKTDITEVRQELDGVKEKISGIDSEGFESIKSDVERTTESVKELNSELTELKSKVSDTSTGNKSNISLENNSTVQQQEKIENDIVESIREQNKAIDETIKKTLTLNDVRQKQYEIIQKTNPRWENSNSFWLTKPSDAKTYYEVAHEDSDWDFNDDYTDDYTVKDKMNIEKAVLNGEMITVYSSKPIVDGNFVTPSKEYAQSYADDGRTVYEAQIDPRDIAWLDVGEGQVAHLSDELKEVILLETQAKIGLVDLSEQNRSVSSETPIKDVFQGDVEKTGMYNIASATEEAVQAKKDFATANEGVQSSVDGSKSKLELEAELMNQIAKSAREAADAKKEFVDANKEVKDSATKSSNSLDKENTSLLSGHSENAEPSGVKKYQKKGYKAHDTGNHDNEKKVTNKAELSKVLKELQTEIIASIDETTSFIKEVTDFYDSADNLVKTQMKVGDKNGSMRTYTTSYSMDKDGNATAWTSHIETQKIEQEEKAVKRLAEEKRKLRQQERQSIQSSVDKALKEQVSAWKQIQSIREKIAKTDNADEINALQESKKYYQEQYNNANKILKANDDLYDKESQIARLEQIRLETNAKIAGYKKNTSLSSMESSLKSYQKQLSDLSIKPDAVHRFPEYQAQLDNINKAIQEYATHISFLQDKGIIDEADINEANRLEEVINNLLKDTKKFSSGDKGFTNIGADKVLEKINSILEQNTRMSKKAKDQIKALYYEIYSGNPSRPLNEMLDEVYKIVQAEREAGRAGKSWLDIFKDKKIYSFLGQAASMFSFYDLINLGRQSFETIRGIDTALVDLKKTTAMNSSQLEEFYYDSNDVAKQMGVTTQAIIEQASAWSRLGYNTKESSTQMAELSSQFAAISPDMDLDTATDGLVSSMKAFDIEVSNVERDIMDNINRIGNTAATSNGEIVDMLTRSSAAMAAANNTIQETIALETAAVEITRNAETTGMKCAA